MVGDAQLATTKGVSKLIQWGELGSMYSSINQDICENLLDPSKRTCPQYGLGRATTDEKNVNGRRGQATI